MVHFSDILIYDVLDAPFGWPVCCGCARSAREHVSEAVLGATVGALPGLAVASLFLVLFNP